MTEPVRGPFERELVQTSPDLIEWTTRQDMEFTGGSEGQGEILGDATFVHAWGEIVRAGQTVSEQVSEPTELHGLFVRVLKQDLAGGGSVTHGDDSFDPVWHGKLLAPDASTTGANGITNYTAAGIAVVFQESNCLWGRSLRDDGSAVSVMRILRPFNALPAGDCSANPFTIGSGSGHSVRVHDLRYAGGDYSSDPAVKWTALKALEYLFACNFRWESQPTPEGLGQSGLEWSISDPENCLGYDLPRYDANGKTLTQVLNDFAGKKRGLTWWVTVSGTTLTVTIASGLASAITVGTTTIPANPNIWDQLDGSDPFLHPFTIRTVSDEVADQIVIQAAPRRIGISLAIFGSGDPYVASADAQLDRGFSSAAETACNTYLDSSNAPARRTSYHQAWRRFQIRAGWNLKQYPVASNVGLSNAFDVSSTPAYGYDGMTGDAGHEASPLFQVAAYALEAHDELPCAVGFTALTIGPRQPIVIVAEDYETGTWIDHTSDWSVSVESSPPAVLVDDRADGFLVREILRAGRKIIVSIGMDDTMPVAVSWVRNPSEWKTTQPRTKLIRRPDMGLDLLLAGMVTGVASDAGGALTTVSSQTTTRDNLPQLRALLAQARAYYEEPYDLVAFTDRGVWDTDPAYRPGTLLGNVMDGANTRVIEAMVTRRRWRREYATADDGIQVPYWSTTWETDIVYPELEAVL
jgi:hypothetical protein